MTPKPSLRSLALFLASLALGAAVTFATTATTEPVGYNTVSLLPNSDTLISVPFHRPAVYVGQVAGISGNVLSVSGSPGWAGNQFVYSAGVQSDTYYAFIRSGAKEGNYYTVTANDAGTVTIDLGGDTLSSLATGDSLSLIPYWTFGTLFPASDADASFAVSASPGVIKTGIYLPNLTAVGTDVAFIGPYFYYNNAWRKFGDPLTNVRSDDIVLPDTYLKFRNNTGANYSFSPIGTVFTQKFGVVLVTQNGGKQDNFVALPRPVAVSLDDSGLIASGAITPSSSPGVIKDSVLVYDNSVAAKNKASTASYFYYNGAWRQFGQPLTQDFGPTLAFKPGEGVVIRKGSTSSGSELWTNPPTY